MTGASVQGAVAPFPSVATLREAHGLLLRRHRNEGDTPEVFAAVEEFLRRGEATGVLLDGDKERWEAQSILDYWSTTLIRVGGPRVELVLAEFDPEQAPELDDSDCPYLGLNAFQEENRDKFFGRERLVEEMIGRLRDHFRRLLIVTGASGSGKSSLVLAGLLPALYEGKLLPGSESWRYYRPLVPGSDPLTNLARAVRPAAEASADWVARQAAAFAADPGHLAQLVREGGLGPAVLVIDQFEEVFTLCADENTRQAFADNLARLAADPESRHTVILTVRSDFEPQMSRLSALQDLLDDARVRVTPTPMSARDLRRVIEEPARQKGLRFEEGLVDELVKEVLGEPAALPLLQFTLLKLWESRNRNRVTWAAYRRLGGARQALARSADEFYDHLLPEDQVKVRQIFLHLVKPGEGQEVMRDRVRRDDLVKAIGGGVGRVLDKLVQANLLLLTRRETRADDRVEVVHEALVRNWPTLVGWLDDARAELRERSRLKADAERWYTRRTDPELLLRGALLEEALRYQDLGPLEKEFVEASRAAAEEAKRQEEAVRLRELEQARALAREQEQAAKKLRRLIAVVIVLAVCAGSLAAYNWVLKGEADKARDDANNRRDEAEKEKRKSSDRLVHLISSKLLQAAAKYSSYRPELTLLLAGKAVDADSKVSLPAEVKRAFVKLRQPPAWPPSMLCSDTGAIRGMAFSRHGNRLVTAGPDNTAMIWDIASRAAKRHLTHDGSVSAVTFSWDGKWVATAGTDKVAKIWDSQSGSVVQSFTGHQAAVTALAFSNTGRELVTADADGTVIIWEAASATKLKTWATNDKMKVNVLAVAFSLDGKRLVTAGGDGIAQVWDTASGKPLTSLSKPGELVYAIAISPSPNPSGTADIARALRVWQVATVSTSGIVRVWHVSETENDTVFPRESFSFSGQRVWSQLGGFTAAITFSPDGKRLAVMSESNGAEMWDMSTHQNLFLTARSWPGQVSGFAISPDAEHFAVSYSKPRTLPLLAPGALTGPAGQGTLLAISGLSFDYADQLIGVYSLRGSDILPSMIKQANAGKGRLTFFDYGELLREIMPENEILLRDGAAQTRGGETELALKTFQEALELPGLNDKDEPKRLVAEVLCDEGRLLAKQGKLSKAADYFRKAMDVNTELHLEPQSEVRKAAVLFYTQQANLQARLEKLEEVVEWLKKEKDADPSLTFDPQQEARRLVAFYLRQQADALARSGNVNSATVAYRKTKELDPSLKFDPETEAKKLAALMLLQKGINLVRAGRVKEAIAAYSDAQSFNPKLQITAGYWNELCWWGCLFDQAPDVLFAGKKAVDLEQNKPNSNYAKYRDTLGLAKALTGDFKGAVEDFEAYIRWAEEPTRASQLRLKVEKRRHWIESLKNNENPFADEVLTQLRHE